MSAAADPARTFRLERATARDAPVVLQMIRALAEYEHLAEQVVATEQSVRESLFGERPYADVVIAYTDQAPIGFAVWFHTYSTFLSRPGVYLEDVFVLPEWRGRGVGRRLLAHVAGVAVSTGCGRMEWSVLDWNESAIGFYRRLGATPMDEWTVYRLTGDALAQLARRVQ